MTKVFVIGIENINLNPAFSPDIFDYVATLENKEITELIVNATTNDENATVEVLGNKNLKDGENVITILVKSSKTNETTTYQITVDTTCLPSDLQVGMKIKFFYSNSIYKLENCGGYMKKILTLNNDFYITKMSRKVDANGDETGSLTLEKYLRIDKKIQKE